ncbi:MAG: LamG domain-containing protein, partial [Planctomycetales bacterium]|nr:LamG domain-containing protein [Planctomycetales bacterium]
MHIVGLIEGANPEQIQTTSFQPSPTEPFTFSFVSDGVSQYRIFTRDNNTRNIAMLSALSLSQVPEPSTALLLGIGLIGLSVRRRRQRAHVTTADRAKTLARTRLTIASCIAMLLAATQAAQAGSLYVNRVLADNPTAYYRFEESSGTSAANSGLLGATYDATHNGGVALGEVGPITGDSTNRAIHLDGSSGYTTINNTIPFGSFQSGTGEYSIEFWYKQDDVGGSEDLVVLTSTGNQHGILLEVANTSGNLRYLHRVPAGGGGGQNINPSTLAGTVNDWNHLVVTHDSANTMRLYLNGVLDSTTNTTSADINYNLDGVFGRLTPGSGPRYFDGSLDEIAFYDFALSAFDVTKHFEAAALIAVPEPSSALLLSVGLVGLTLRRRQRIAKRKTVTPNCQLSVVFLVAILVGVSASHAAVIVEYNLDPPPAGNPNLAATLVNGQVSVSDISGGAGLTINSQSGYASQVMRLNTTVTTSTESAAIANDAYISFTVTPTSSQLMNLQNLTFDAARGGSTTPRSWYLYSSIDGFTFDNSIDQADVPTVRPTLTGFDVDLSSASFQGLTTPIEFRLYMSTPATGSSLEFDNFVLNGTFAAPVPEPSTLLLLGLGMLGYCLRRRRAVQTTLALMLAATLGMNSAEASKITLSPYASIDIGPNGQRVDTIDGWSGLPGTAPNNNVNGTNYGPTGTVASINGDLLTFTIDNLNASGTPTGGIDWRDRGNSTSTDSLVEMGEDFVKNNAGFVRVTLDGMSSGLYQVTSYHIDADNDQSGAISVFVNTGGSFVDTGVDGNSDFLTGGVNNLTTTNITATSATFTFSTNGIDPVILLFDGSAFGDTETPLNGLFIQLAQTPEPSTALMLGLGLVGLACRRRRASQAAMALMVVTALGVSSAEASKLTISPYTRFDFGVTGQRVASGWNGITQASGNVATTG